MYTPAWNSWESAVAKMCRTSISTSIKWKTFARTIARTTALHEQKNLLCTYKINACTYNCFWSTVCTYQHSFVRTSGSNKTQLNTWPWETVYMYNCTYKVTVNDQHSFCTYKWYEQNSVEHVAMGNSIHVQLYVQGNCLYVPTFLCTYKWYEQNSVEHVAMRKYTCTLYVQGKTCMSTPA